MSKVEKGSVVKFYDNNGVLDGGTVVDIIESEGKIKVCLINTLIGKRIQKPYEDIVLCKYQRKGKVSEAFINKLQKEIVKENKERVKSSVDTRSTIEEVVPVKSVSENEIVDRNLINNLQLEIAEKNERIKELEDQILILNKRSFDIPFEDNHVKTIIAMKQSLMSCFNGDASGISVVPLLTLIMELNKIER